ncbi:sugar MFS transporter, partial [Proteus mirabilis]|uniref:sugar MFS transporter n=1 Tax=Proteus mirabilis TaxID=584 RepID=UPI0013D845C9
GLASFVSPLAFQWLMERPGAAGSSLVWVAFYWAFTVGFVALILANQLLPLPRVELKDDERAAGWAAYRELLARRDVWLFFIGIMAY